MSKLYITEYDRLASQEYGPPVPVGLEPALGTSVIDYTSGATASGPFNDKTRFIMVHTDAICHIKIGVDPTATTNHPRIPADATLFYGIDPGKNLKIAAIGGS